MVELRIFGGRMVVRRFGGRMVELWMRTGLQWRGLANGRVSSLAVTHGEEHD